MGKNSKNKSKKLAKQGREAHLKHLEVFKSTYFFLDQQIKSRKDGREREACIIRKQQLQLTLQSKEVYIALGEHKQFSYWLSRSYAGLIPHQIMCQNYTEALASVTNWLMKFPKIDSFDRKSVESWKDLILLRLDGFNNDRIQRIIQNVVEIIGKDGVEINEDLGKTLFVTHALSELSRQQLFGSVQYLSMQIRQKIKEVPQGSNYINLVQLATMFFVYSTSEEFYHALGHDDDVPLRHGTMEKLFSRPKPLDLPSRTGYLAASLYNSYLFFCNQKEFPPDKLNEAIKMMEMYLNDKSSSLNMICYTCDDEDTKDHEVFVCQGCRVVCYCCKGHQRLNYLHHENTGTRGLGHKHLCPVYKAFRKKRDNTDSSKDSHLERKFQRACKRFFYSALNSIGKRFL